MKVIYDIEEFDPQKPVVLTQGTFDGVHFGHRRILRHVVSEAKKIDGVSVLLTFYPHPRLVLYPDDNELKLLTTIEEKVDLVSWATSACFFVKQTMYPNGACTFYLSQH